MKSRLLMYRIVVLMVCFCLSFATGTAAQTGTDPDVKISLEELKLLLKSDIDEISLTWEEFQQLVNQTGQDVNIPYTLKDGKVILPREQFRQLLDSMQPPQKSVISPPADYVVTKAEYQGRMDEDNITFTALFYVEIFEREEAKYHTIPFLPQSVALTEVLLDDEPALVLEADGWYAVTTPESGQHVLKVHYYAPHNLGKGPQLFNLPMIKTAITLVGLEIPLEDIDVDIPHARELTVLQENGKTWMNAVLPAMDAMIVNIHRTYVAVEEGAEEGTEETRPSAKIYAETLNLLSIEEDALRVNSRVKLNVLQQPIDFIEVKVPEGYSILYVRKADGTELRDWRSEDSESGTLLRIPFDVPVEGSLVVSILAEKLFELEETAMNFTGFQVVGAIRETGFVGAEKKSTAEARATEVEQLDRIDIQEIPYELINMTERPLLFGFRYLRHPFTLGLTITEHEELPVISTVIDMASVITVVLEDGKFLTKVVYTMRNTWKQFLELNLPSDSEVWTVYVAGKRESASKSAEGTFMIPLARSEMRGELLQSFQVDLMYYTRGKSLGFIGSGKTPFPTADVMISKMLWSVYLPRDFRYLHFSGNVEKEKIAKTLNLLSGKRRVFDFSSINSVKQVIERSRQSYQEADLQTIEQGLYDSEFENQAIRQSDVTSQVWNEAVLDEMLQTEKQRGVGQPGAGGDIFKIELPTSGQLYRFNKTVIEGDPIHLRFYYLSSNTMTIVKSLMGIIVLGLIILWRRKLVALIRGIYRWGSNRRHFWKFLRTKPGMRLALFGAAFIFFFFSPILFVVLALLFLISLFRPGWLLREKSSEKGA